MMRTNMPLKLPGPDISRGGGQTHAGVLAMGRASALAAR